jgi:leader peptidase (prepilin peptidase) / N-methyltransferase
MSRDQAKLRIIQSSPERGALSLHLLAIIAFFLFGLIFGSFLNVCIYRMPRGLSVVRPRSACPACNTPIAAYDNVPVLSWLALGGKCRHCKATISARYAAVELLTGILFVLSYISVPLVLSYLQLEFSSWGELLPRVNPILIAAKSCVFSFLLIGLVFTDAETKLLPDLLTKPGIVLGLLFSLLAPVEGPAREFTARWGDIDWRIVSLMNSLAGAIFGMSFILGASLLYEALRGVKGMGMGDVKLLALIGAFLGIKLTLLVLFLATVVGSIFGVVLMLAVWRKRVARRRRRNSEPADVARAKAWQSARLIFRNFEIPFGVFLGTAAAVAAFAGVPLIHWYLGLSR